MWDYAIHRYTGMLLIFLPISLLNTIVIQRESTYIDQYCILLLKLFKKMSGGYPSVIRNVQTRRWAFDDR